MSVTEEKPTEKRSTRSRRCTSKASLSPKVISSTSNAAAREKTEKLKKNYSNSDGETKEGEYEVRKIKDYIRKQVSLLLFLTLLQQMLFK